MAFIPFLFSFSSISTVFLITITLIALYILNRKKTNSKQKNKNYKLIKSYSDLSPYITEIQNAKQIGIDTEYYKGEQYKGHLCLIQIHIKKIPFSLIIDIISLTQEEKGKIYNFLKPILSDRNNEKIFHSCFNDVEWIKEETGCDTYNIFDTQEVHQLIKHNNSFKSLTELLHEYLNVNFSLEEKKKFQKSNWFERPLTDEQLTYAANDSLYLIKLREAMMKKLKSKEELDKKKKEIEDKIYKLSKREKNYTQAVDYMISNMTKCDVELYDTIKNLFCEIYQKTDDYSKSNNINSDKMLNLKTIYKICNQLPKTKEDIMTTILLKTSNEHISKHQKFYDEIVDMVLSKTKNITADIKSEINLGKTGYMLNNLRKDLSKEKTVERFSCKKPIYESCKMLAPDGEALCFCDTKKMNWYISRKLAEIIQEDPPIFRLFFEPNARGCKDEDDKDSKFYVSERKNRCVVCGSEENYMRFHVVPLLYRQFFPEMLKSHKSHDVNLLCFRCHEKANKLYEKKKEELAEKYNVPLTLQTKEQEFVKLLEELIKKCKSLYKNWNTIPFSQKEKIQKIIFQIINDIKQIEYFTNPSTNIEVLNTLKQKKCFDITNALDIDLAYITSVKGLKLKELPDNKKNLHGKLVVEKVGDLKEFIKEWRQFFVDSLNPQFLSSEWRVDHEMVRTFGKFSNFNKEKNKEENNKE